jgi:peptide/nickel transport system ATP-binding protein/oligopeptide transport system ATP-binding protein
MSTLGSAPLLAVDRLVTQFPTKFGLINAVDEVSFGVHAGETVGLVGESGCGKSVTSLSIMRLIDSGNGKITAGSISFGDKDLLRVSASAMRQIRGNRISMIFQEPKSIASIASSALRQRGAKRKRCST